MDYKYKQLEQELSALSKVFSELGIRLSEVAKEVTSPGVMPSEKVLEQISASRTSFENARTAVHGHAGAMLVSPLPRLGELVSIAAIDVLLKASAVAEENKFSIEAERQEALAILGRVLSIAHRDGGEFKPLQECHAKVGGLRSAISNIAWPYRHPDSEPIVASKHPVNALLTFVENLDTVDDDNWMALETTITESYGKPLFVAASRGKLVVSEVKSEASPAPVKPIAAVPVSAPAPSKPPAPAAEAPKPAVPAEKPVEKKIVTEKALEKPAVAAQPPAAPAAPAVAPSSPAAAPALAAEKKVAAPPAPVPAIAPEKKEVAQEKPAPRPPAPAVVVATAPAPVVSAEKKEVVERPQPQLVPTPTAVASAPPAPVAAAPSAPVATAVVPAASPAIAAVPPSPAAVVVPTPVAAAPTPLPRPPAPVPAAAPVAQVNPTPVPPAPIPVAPPVAAAPAAPNHTHAAPPVAVAQNVANSLAALATATEPAADKKTAAATTIDIADKQRKEPRLATTATATQTSPKADMKAPELISEEEAQQQAAAGGDASQRPQRWGFWRGNR